MEGEAGTETEGLGERERLRRTELTTLVLRDERTLRDDDVLAK